MYSFIRRPVGFTCQEGNALMFFVVFHIWSGDGYIFGILKKWDLDARIDERWNMDILLRFSHICDSPGYSGYNPYAFHNPAHHVSGVPKSDVARWWILFFVVLIHSSNRYVVNPVCIVLWRILLSMPITHRNYRNPVATSRCNASDPATVPMHQW